jgi:hypothetical protein
MLVVSDIGIMEVSPKEACVSLGFIKTPSCGRLIYEEHNPGIFHV